MNKINLKKLTKLEIKNVNGGNNPDPDACAGCHLGKWVRALWDIRIMVSNPLF